MSFKEVTALRKSGALDEALDMARKDYAHSIDDYSSSALFWVLKAVCERSLQVGDETNAEVYFSELQSVFQHLNDAEGFAQRSINTLEQKLNPVFAKILQEMTNARNGSTEEAYECISQINADGFPDRVLDNIAWIIFYYLRAHLETLSVEEYNEVCTKYLNLGNPRPSLVHSQILILTIKFCGLHPNFSLLRFIENWGVDSFLPEDLQGNPDFAGGLSLRDRAIRRCFLDKSVSLQETTTLFARDNQEEKRKIEIILSHAYSSILYKDDVEEHNNSKFFADADEYVSRLKGVSLQNEYHSKILESVLWRIDDKRITWFKSFFEGWGFGNSLMDSDWESRQKEGKIIQSTAEKALSKYDEALKISGVSNPPSEYKALLVSALAKLKNNENIARRIAKIEYQAGNVSEAIRITKELIQTHTGKFYFWSELAEFVEQTDPELYISCCAKALLASPEEKYVGKIHLKFGNFLCDKGRFPEALHEAVAYLKTAMENKWPIRSQFGELKMRIPDNITETEDNTSIYREYERLADEFIYSSIDGHDMILLDSKVEEKLDGKKKLYFYLYDSNKEMYRVNPNAYSLDREAKIGSCFHVNYIESDGKKKIVLVKPIKKVDILDYQPVVVDDINYEKNVFHVVGNNIQLVIPNSKAPFKIKVGMTLEVATKKRIKDEKTYFVALNIRKADKSSLIQEFEGNLSIKQNEKGIFGFVDKVYIHRKFLSDLNNDDFVHGTGIITNGKFTVLTLERVQK